jgi:Ca2+-binding EF-hand superfamily protein
MKRLLAITVGTLSVVAWTSPSVWADGAQRDIIVENFMQADVNADGALSLDEFTALIDLNAADGVARASMIKRMGRQPMAFGRLDANSDGLITNDEISAMTANEKR